MEASELATSLRCDDHASGPNNPTSHDAVQGPAGDEAAQVSSLQLHFRAAAADRNLQEQPPHSQLEMLASQHVSRLIDEAQGVEKRIIGLASLVTPRSVGQLQSVSGLSSQRRQLCDVLGSIAAEAYELYKLLKTDEVAEPPEAGRSLPLSHHGHSAVSRKRRQEPELHVHESYSHH
jgi:hypothetical protein